MIRTANINDRDDYLALARTFYKSDAVAHDVPFSHFEVTFDAAIAGNPCCHLAMMEVDGKVVGFGLLAVTFSCEAGGETVWLEEAYILEEYRSLGLGKEFFQYTYGQYPNAKRFRLEVAPDNTRAIELYTRLGYKVLDYKQMYMDKD